MARLAIILMAALMGLNLQTNPKASNPMSTRDIYFAGGCFWGTEHFFKQVRGVIATKVGYANGNTPNPTYQEVCTSRSGYAETVLVQYDPNIVSLELLIELYFKTIDPTSRNRQGNDIGLQYRTGIYYTNSADAQIVERAVSRIAQKIDQPIAVERMPLRNFYPAEEYHQNYLDNHPGGYCHISPALFAQARNANPATTARYTRPDQQTLRAKLTPIQFAVTQQNATEPPFTNEYWNENRKGIYVDITTGQPLFLSTDKFDSGCGWPAFAKPIDDKLLAERTDRSHGMIRTEIRSASGDAHLGHLFDDGSNELGGLRYCINSAALRFIPLEQMEEEGYADYIPLLDK